MIRMNIKARNRSALMWSGLLLVAAVMPACPALGRAILRVETDPQAPAVTVLSWDTEGGEQAAMNLLRAATGIRVRVAGAWTEATAGPLESETDTGLRRYRFSPVDAILLTWTVAVHDADLSLILAGEGDGLNRVEAVELTFPFNPRVTPTTVLPARWAEDGTFRLPALLSAPDFGQMRMTAEPEARQGRVTGRLEGSRNEALVDLIVRLPAPTVAEPIRLNLRPWVLPAPEGLEDRALWAAARRGWFNIYQCTARWGDQTAPFSAPAGIQACNVISDPCSMTLYMTADAALLVPELAPGVSAMEQVRYSLDWWLDRRMLESGEIIGYRGDYVDFLDTNPSILISAWNYVEATSDLRWLERRMDKLERVAEFTRGRDTDGDGLFEAVQSGNRGTLLGPKRSCSAWDAINCGHKDAYSNALIYRAWRCMADLQARLGRPEQAARYLQLAARLKDAYARTLINPKTGYVAWWKSQDGELHDFASPLINGIAIHYGLIDPEPGRKILQNLRAKIRKAGFRRPELGVPITLLPIPRADYLIEYPHGIAGCPIREDGTDTFGQYLNGGVWPVANLDFLAAHYKLGEDRHADAILRAMLRRQTEGAWPNGGGFQNGFVDSYPHGAEAVDWEGNPCGYEGYMAETFVYLQAVLLREPLFSQRLYRTLKNAPPPGRHRPAARNRSISPSTAADFVVPPGQRQLFLDDHGIAEMSNLSRTMHAPVKRGAVVRPDQPWETTLQTRCAPTWNPERKVWQLWLITSTNIPDFAGGTSYAESSDGIHWIKPVLGQTEINGSNQNNFISVVPGDTWPKNAIENVVIDPDDPDHGRRYKGFYGAFGRRPMVSPDGTHWTLLNVPELPSSDESNLSHDRASGIFIATLKRGGPFGRSHAIWTSPDFLTWTDTGALFHADELDQELAASNIAARVADPTLQQPMANNPAEYNADIYNVGVFRYEGLYIGLPAVYHATGRYEDNTDGFQLIQLACSRDLGNWRRLGDRQPFIGPSPVESDNWDRTQLLPPSAPVVRDNELWFYYTGIKYRVSPADADEKKGAICLAVLRRDGFISLDAAEEEGRLTTMPFVLRGERLYVNAAVRAEGRFLIEALDETGQVLATSAPLSGDHLALTVTWDQGNLAATKGRIVQLRFTMREASLYSYWLAGND